MENEDDLWFLPGPPIDEAPTDPPWRLAEQQAIFSPKDWRRAEAAQGRGLARAAAAFARLDARMTKGFAKRLALSEVSALMWAQGDWVPIEKITLYGLLREGALCQARELSTADWAMRRLLGGALPDDLAAFLGRHRVEYDGLEMAGLTKAIHAFGNEYEGLAEDWQGARSALIDAHPITQAAALFSAWRAFGLSEPGGALAAGVVASKIGAAEGRALHFLPVASGGAIGRGGSVDDRLTHWFKAVENACQRAEMQIDQLNEWQGRATSTTKHLSGKTPPLLITALIENPMLSASMAAEICGCDKATARRNINAFAKHGLVREVTGQGRYRFWAVG